jgi:hypothetical protein
MAHGKIRTEKNCLNCNAQIYGRFCSVCGQENIEPKETFWQLLSHFVYDLFHYDGKAVSTIKTLLFHPGLLTHEYVRGRRASYLHPIRLYIFISAVFFLLVFTLINSEQQKADKNFEAKILQKKDSLSKQLSITLDTVKKKEINNELKVQDEILHVYNVSGMMMDSADIKSSDTGIVSAGLFGDSLSQSVSAYDSLQKSLPDSSKDNWLIHQLKRKVIAINLKYKGRQKEFFADFKEKFIHSLPQMMFVSLPAAALIFSLLYVRRKQFTYVQHGVFTVHIYSAVFIFILILYGLSIVNNYMHWKILNIAITIGILLIYYYLYKAMRNFYEQRRFKTILKYFIFLLCYSIVLSLLMIVFLLTSLIQV